MLAVPRARKKVKGRIGLDVTAVYGESLSDVGRCRLSRQPVRHAGNSLQRRIGIEQKRTCAERREGPAHRRPVFCLGSVRAPRAFWRVGAIGEGRGAKRGGEAGDEAGGKKL